MVITASYGISENVILTTAEVTGYQVSPQTLTDGVTYVTITYSELGETRSTTQEVHVTHRLTAIEITQEPATLVYEYGDTLQIAGMVVQATYSDGEQVNISGYQHAPSTLNTVGQQTITVTYSENGVTEQDTFQVTVNRKSVAKPTWNGNLTYTGSSQSVTSTSYWNNYNTTYMTIGGTTSGTNAGIYTATFTLGSNYRWTDGTTTILDVDWSIAKAAGSLRVQPTTVDLNGSNYSTGINVTITRSGDGTISYSPTSVSGLTMSLNGNTLNIRGNGSTAISGRVITISVAEGTNYLAPSSRTVTVNATYWDWGSETAVGDQDWWASLKTWARSASASERQACVGKTKKVSLSSAVLGANQALMRCIGYDRDGTGTLAFQTAGTLPNSLEFGNSAVWMNSDARTQCRNFASRCSASNSITTVSKGTCPNTNDSRNGSVTYNSETGWLPSEREMGLDTWSPLSTANSSTSKAECTQGYNAPYQYYDSNADRIKYGMDASGNVGNTARYYWERSRYYSSSNGVCRVYTNGTASYNNYSGGRYLAPAFVI